MKKLIASILMVGVFGLFVFSTASIRSAAARKITLKEILNLAPADIHVDEGYEAPSLESMSGSVDVTVSQQATNEQLVAEASALIERAAQAYLAPGWLHIVAKTEDFVTASQTLPDGSPVPTSARNESWILLDEEGFAVQIATIDDTGDPRMSQTSTYDNGLWQNITLETSIRDDERFKPSLDSNFLGLATTYQDILEITGEPGELNGQPVTIYTMTEIFKQPIKMDGSSEMTTGTIRKFYFSNETGVLLRLERYSLSTSGDLIPVRVIDTLLIERIEMPPADVLTLFSK